jgi:phosphopantothenoylcysteine decarboxylase/phosphopantothenate--cysteine ligase
VDLPTPPGAQRVDVTDAADLARAVQERRTGADVLVMAAAVADFTPASRVATKIKKPDVPDGAPDQGHALDLVRTPDVLRSSVEDREARRTGAASALTVPPQVIVGFAAETGDETTSAREHARAKARRKGADLLVFNDITGGVFGSEDNRVLVLDAEGEELTSAQGPKVHVAHEVLTQASTLLSRVPLHP